MNDDDFWGLLAYNLGLVIKMLLLMAPIPLVFLAVYLGVLYIKPYTPHWLNTTFSVLVAITLCHRLLHRKASSSTSTSPHGDPTAKKRNDAHSDGGKVKISPTLPPSDISPP